MRISTKKQHLRTSNILKHIPTNTF